ncbi:MAG: sulfatase-like hydrolase/transferase [Clostridia bacterium]|nr:sulfatase-like hydrolase/transferase [Clostridia bacterium]
MSHTERRPNILFLMADQFRGDAMSCVGGKANTKNLDEIASEGVVFTQCSTTAPLCVPARVALFSGKYAHTTGAWDNKKFILSPDANIWSKEIKNQGYNTALIGKTHLHGGGGDIIGREPLVNAYGFDMVNEMTGPHACLTARTYMTEEWREKGLFDAFCEDINRRGKAPFAQPSPLPLEDYYDVYVGKHGREFLENAESDKPWFCHISFGGPHEPWDTPEPYASMYDPADMPKPLPRMKDANPDRPRGVTDGLMSKAKISCNEEQAAEIRADYCGGCALIDEQIGRIIDVIKARGEWDNTVVLFTSDHGEMNGDHGFVNKRTFLDGALNVPLIIRTPETAKQGGKKCDALVSLMDVGPTLVELAGGKIEYEQFGKSLCGVLDGSEAQPRDYVLSELSGEIMYMDNEWKIVVNAEGDVYMLFDRVNDKNEQNNLAASAEAQEITHRLREKMLKAIMQTQCHTPAVVQQHKAFMV